MRARHRFRVRGRDLYAWCALDTLFLPGLIGKPATIESTCPATGTPIRLMVNPTEVKEYTPSTTVVSIVLPGTFCQPDRSGPQNDMCSQMDYFTSCGEDPRKGAHVCYRNFP